MISKEFRDNRFQWRLTPDLNIEVLPGFENVKLNPNTNTGTVVFDKTKFAELVATGDLDKIKEYLDKCGKSYIIDDSDPNKTAITVDKMTVYVHKASSTNTKTTDVKTLVDQYIDMWVNDFKTGYKRWGLDKAPTEAQINTFKNTLGNACSNTTSIKDTTEEGVKVWVRAQANVAITQVKFDSYYDGLVDMFAKSFADFGLDSNLTGDELKQVKDAFENAYKAGLNNHVASINAKGNHQIESNSDLQAWFKSLLTEALKPVKTARGVKAGEVTGGQLQQWHLLGSPYFEQTDHGTFKLKSGFYIGTEEIKTVQQLLDALQKGKTITTEPVNESPTTPTTSSTTTTPDNKEAYSIIARKADYVSSHLPDCAKVEGNFDPRGSVSNTKQTEIYNALLNDIRNAVLDTKGDDFFKNTIGEATFQKLFNTAWIQVMESKGSYNVNINDFAKAVLKQLKSIMTNLQQHPENSEYLSGVNVNTKVSSLKHRSINPSDFIKYDTGEYHLTDDTSDATFQEYCNTLLNRIYDAYPNIDKAALKKLFNYAQGNALKALKGTDGCVLPNGYTQGTKSILPSTIGTLIMYKFNNLIADYLTGNSKYVGWPNDGTMPTRQAGATETKTTKSNQTDAQNTAYKEGAAGLKSIITNTREIRNLVSSCNEASRTDRPNNVPDGNMHTEFGIDGNGNIVFQEKATTRVYNTLVTYLTDWVKESAGEAYNKIGEKNFKLLIQSAWIMAYNSFDSSKTGGNKVEDFIKKVMENLNKMLDKISTNPELMEAYTKRTSYADTSLTDGLRHYGTNTTYGNDQNIYYQGTITQHKDGTVHISQTNDDNDYQTTMNALLTRVIAKYSSVDSNVVTNVFREAQKAALKAAQSNTEDCPYGTGNNSSKVGDSSRNWGGADSRKGDNGYITMDRLVQLTLYYFDKLLMQELTK